MKERVRALASSPAMASTVPDGEAEALKRRRANAKDERRRGEEEKPKRKRRGGFPLDVP
ncbi:UNVERIFIED_CONTAM: hypothetical protein HHA_449250 [Hammondia hammondi]|eukprot:XP_008881834.1 hypothetical protein HHA_449250 [Hammondia hammondi]